MNGRGIRKEKVADSKISGDTLVHMYPDIYFFFISALLGLTSKKKKKGKHTIVVLNTIIRRPKRAGAKGTRGPMLGTPL